MTAGRRKREFTADETAEFKKLWNGATPIKVLAQRFHVNKSTIKGVAHRLGLEPRRHVGRPKGVGVTPIDIGPCENVPRRCCCCGREFLAATRFIRRCDPCKRGELFTSAAEDYRVAYG